MVGAGGLLLPSNSLGCLLVVGWLGEDAVELGGADAVGQGVGEATGEDMRDEPVGEREQAGCVAFGVGVGGLTAADLFGEGVARRAESATRVVAISGWSTARLRKAAAAWTWHERDDLSPR